MKPSARFCLTLGALVVTGCGGVRWDQSDQVAKRIIGVFPTTKLAIAGDYKYHPEYLVGSIACVYLNDDITRLADVPGVVRPALQTVTELSPKDPSKGLMASGYATAEVGAAIQAAVAGGKIDTHSAWSYQIQDTTAAVLPKALPQAKVNKVVATLTAQQVPANCELVAITGVALVYLHSEQMTSIKANAQDVVGPAIGFGGNVYAKVEQSGQNNAWFIRVAKQPVARPSGAPAYMPPSSTPPPGADPTARLSAALGRLGAIENLGPFQTRLSDSRLPQVRTGPDVAPPPQTQVALF